MFIQIEGENMENSFAKLFVIDARSTADERFDNRLEWSLIDLTCENQ